MEREIDFLDVMPDDWYYSAVLDVYRAGLMSGLSATNFGATEPLSRVQFVTVLYRLAGSPETEYREVFTDVPDGQWYTRSIMWASQKGIVSGYGNGSFGVGDPLTREQMLTFLYRFAKAEGMDTGKQSDLSTYADREDISNFALDAVRWAAAEGLLPDREEGKIGARNVSTRADCAYLVSAYRKLREN